MYFTLRVASCQGPLRPGDGTSTCDTPGRQPEGGQNPPPRLRAASASCALASPATAAARGHQVKPDSEGLRVRQLSRSRNTSLASPEAVLSGPGGREFKFPDRTVTVPGETALFKFSSPANSCWCAQTAMGRRCAAPAPGRGPWAGAAGVRLGRRTIHVSLLRSRPYPASAGTNWPGVAPPNPARFRVRRQVLRPRAGHCGRIAVAWP